MILSTALWVLVWAGMYSDVSRFRWDDLLRSPAGFLLALRPFLPIIAMLLGLVLFRRSGRTAPPLSAGPLAALGLYGLIGGLFFFLSPDPFVSLYWAALFLAVIVTAWSLANRDEPEAQVRALMNVNAAVVITLVVFYLAGPLWPILMGAHNPRLYKLPFGLGIQTANGVGRFAGVLALISLSRLREPELLKKAAWSGLLALSVLGLALSESRTAILGFVVGTLLIVLANRKFSWLAAIVPGLFFFLYKAWFVWRFKGSLENAFFLTGRETTWRKAIDLAFRSPFVGHGFHADRLILEGEHVHMAYLHSLIQSGIVGALLFTGAIVGIWVLVARNHVVQRAFLVEGAANFPLTESVAVLGFLTARSFFESTAAFYGVDLLLLAPVVAYLQIWCRDNPRPEPHAAP
jgi:O-antigen ligase